MSSSSIASPVYSHHSTSQEAHIAKGTVMRSSPDFMRNQDTIKNGRDDGAKDASKRDGFDIKSIRYGRGFHGNGKPAGHMPAGGSKATSLEPEVKPNDRGIKYSTPVQTSN